MLFHCYGTRLLVWRMLLHMDVYFPKNLNYCSKIFLCACVNSFRCPTGRINFFDRVSCFCFCHATAQNISGCWIIRDVKIRKKIFHPENNTYILFLRKKCFFVSIQYRYQYCTFSTNFRWTRLHKTIWASTIGDKCSISFPAFFFLQWNK